MKNDNLNFPDKKYLQNLSRHTQSIIGRRLPLKNQLMAHSGVMLNWVSDYLTDSNIQWLKKKIKLDDLTLTGTNPRWNKIIIEKCERSPQKLRALFKTNKSLKSVFKTAKFSALPILVRLEKKKYSVLDGMYRVIAAIRDNKTGVAAFVAKKAGKPKPQCEPHVVYDLLRAYQRGLNKDRKALITALRFLRKSYSNVTDLLKERFNKDWVRDEEIQKIIREALR